MLVGEPRVHRASWPAIGTTAVVDVVDPDALADAETLLRGELERIDRAASWFRDDSELAALHAADGRMTAVSTLLGEAIAVAVRAAAMTDGLVDPTLGACPGWSAIELRDWAVRLPAGVRLDLGATAKAFVADRAAQAIAAATGSGVLVSLGGDVRVAGEAPAGGWPIHVTDDHRSGTDAAGQTVWIAGGALATSGTTVRPGPDGTGHHILDPRTGHPAVTPWRTVSVTAASCVDANTASTAAIVLGAEAPEWLSARGLAARLVGHDGAIVSTHGWPEAA